MIIVGVFTRTCFVKGHGITCLRIINCLQRASANGHLVCITHIIQVPSSDGNNEQISTSLKKTSPTYLDVSSKKKNLAFFEIFL